eukprot:GHVS01025406.1.p1 GENE.GHVS01025406.1~~GHVS01025406.1.p1  ORF type:complete len:179 (-),score=57.95 GHVS01025406.1:113-589(-)
MATATADSSDALDIRSADSSAAAGFAAAFGISSSSSSSSAVCSFPSPSSSCADFAPRHRKLISPSVKLAQLLLAHHFDDVNNNHNNNNITSTTTLVSPCCSSTCSALLQGWVCSSPTQITGKCTYTKITTIHKQTNIYHSPSLLHFVLLPFHLCVVYV